MAGISQQARLEMIEAEMEDQPLEIYNRYRDMIAEGQSPVFAQMAAMQWAPTMGNSDRSFCKGQREKMLGMNPKARDEIQRRAGLAGINTDGKYYVSGLGKYTDSEAWVTSSEDVLNVAKRRNLNIRGAINHKSVDKMEGPPPKKALADDIADGYIRDHLKNSPRDVEKVHKNPKYLKEIKEMVVDMHGAKD